MKNPKECHKQVGDVIGLGYNPGQKSSVRFCNAEASKGGNCCSDNDENRIVFLW